MNMDDNCYWVSMIYFVGYESEIVVSVRIYYCGCHRYICVGLIRGCSPVVLLMQSGEVMPLPIVGVLLM